MAGAAVVEQSCPRKGMRTEPADWSESSPSMTPGWFIKAFSGRASNRRSKKRQPERSRSDCNSRLREA
jgi:hypothetical protein